MLNVIHIDARRKSHGIPPNTLTIDNSGKLSAIKISICQRRLKSFPETIWNEVIGVVISTGSVLRYISWFIAVLHIMTMMICAATNWKMTIEETIIFEASAILETL